MASKQALPVDKFLNRGKRYISEKKEKRDFKRMKVKQTYQKVLKKENEFIAERPAFYNEIFKSDSDAKDVEKEVATADFPSNTVNDQDSKVGPVNANSSRTKLKPRPKRGKKPPNQLTRLYEDVQKKKAEEGKKREEEQAERLKRFKENKRRQNQRKKERGKIMHAKTSRGQPIMGMTVERLLQKIEKKD
eukprot:GCRY01002148.1.p1 GENE.GCRY01002148.1~~GCRY01002148.1.p1  ORF type:complete len:190 (-),score=29.81 GCRY01002148.1:226-795(-)